MGTWGAGIFANDVAADIRDDDRAQIADGMSAPDATDALLRRWNDPQRDELPGIQFWLALAALQCRLGRLEDRVRDQAVGIIDAGADLNQWKEDAPGDLGRRRRVLSHLRSRLVGPQRAPIHVRRRSPMTPTHTPGEIVAFELDDGRYLLLRVVGHSADSDSGDTLAVMELLRWIGSEIPDAATIARLPALAWDREFRRPTPYFVPMVLTRSVRLRLSVIGHFKPPRPRSARSLGQRLCRRGKSAWEYVPWVGWASIPDEALRLLEERAPAREGHP